MVKKATPSMPPRGICSAGFAAGVFVASLLAAPQAAEAALVVADFNDLQTGDLTNQTGGSGFTGPWQGHSAWPDVVAGDLSSDLYPMQQTGAGRAVQNPGTDSAKIIRPMDQMDGTIWFTVLLNNVAQQGRVGLAFNGVSTGAAGPNPLDLILVDNQLRIRSNYSGTEQTLASADGSGRGNTQLVLGRITVNSSGTNDQVSVWLNPDLTQLTDPSELPAPLYDAAPGDLVGNGVSNIGIITYSGSLPQAGGIIDHIRLSNNDNGFYEVTGVPEPSVIGLLGAGGAVMAARRGRP